MIQFKIIKYNLNWQLKNIYTTSFYLVSQKASFSLFSFAFWDEIFRGKSLLVQQVSKRDTLLSCNLLGVFTSS